MYIHVYVCVCVCVNLSSKTHLNNHKMYRYYIQIFCCPNSCFNQLIMLTLSLSFCPILSLDYSYEYELNLCIIKSRLHIVYSCLYSLWLI